MLLIAFGVIRIGLAPLRASAAAIEGRAGADLRPLPASPYRELSPLIDAINRLMARLSRRIDHEHEFLSEAAHELKTPLAAIQITTHLLCARLDKLGEGEGAGAPAKGLRDGVARASHVVHQLLALERIQAEAHIEAASPIALDALVRDRLAHAVAPALARGIEIEFEVAGACTLPLHRESMAALLDNLIGNAVKYSPDDASVRVTLHGDPTGAMLTIRDRGPGVAPELRSKVFERFFRIPGTDQPGSGLGLAIAERAAARNGAAVSLHTPNAGPGLEVRVDWRC